MAALPPGLKLVDQLNQAIDCERRARRQLDDKDRIIFDQAQKLRDLREENERLTAFIQNSALSIQH